MPTTRLWEVRFAMIAVRMAHQSPYVHQTRAKTENRRIQNGLRIRKRKLVDIGEISDEEE